MVNEDVAVLWSTKCPLVKRWVNIAEELTAVQCVMSVYELYKFIFLTASKWNSATHAQNLTCKALRQSCMYRNQFVNYMAVSGCEMTIMKIIDHFHSGLLSTSNVLLILPWHSAKSKNVLNIKSCKSHLWLLGPYCKCILLWWINADSINIFCKNILTTIHLWSKNMSQIARNKIWLHSSLHLASTLKSFDSKNKNLHGLLLQICHQLKILSLALTRQTAT